MKKINPLIVIALFIFGSVINLKAQIITDMATYNYTANGLINQKEIGEAVAYDATNNKIYAAGEQRKENDGQGVRIVKYDWAMVQELTVKYDSLPFKEYVSQVIFYGSKLYVVCNAVEISTGNSYLLLLKYSNNLVLEQSKWFINQKYNSPAKAMVINLSTVTTIYVACYKKSGTANNFVVLKMNSSFGSVSAYNPQVTTFNRVPKDILFGGYPDAGIYVCGSAAEIATGNTAVWVMRMSSSLAFSWEKTGTYKSLKNVYNSIRITGDSLYAGGCEKNSSRYLWTLRKIDKNTGTTLKTVTHGSIDYNSEVVKITYARDNGVIVAGYLSSSTLNEYRAKVVKYTSNLASPQYSNVTLQLNSTLNDAATYSDYPNIGSTAITGSKGAGTNKSMFLYIFDNSNGSQAFSFAYTNRDAGGNKIIAHSWSEYIVTGYSDDNSGVVAPDYMITSWKTAYVIPRLGDTDEKNSAADLKVFPNPASDLLNIESSEALKKLTLLDMQGKTVMQNQVAAETLTQQMNISHLPNGVYFLRVNDDKTQKIIKN